jgi:uncharacterized protein (TIGR03435 family)
MLRAFLLERFALETHREIQTLPAYALVLDRQDGRLGSELRRVDVDCAALRAAKQDPQGRNGTPCGGFIALGPGHYTGHGVSMAMIAKQISAATGRVVVDRSRLDGVFDLNLEWRPDDVHIADDPGAPAANPFGVSIMTALREQLGLKLESAKVPVDVLVIDPAEAPIPD